jgi:hypothetical protein
MGGSPGVVLTPLFDVPFFEPAIREQLFANERVVGCELVGLLARASLEGDEATSTVDKRAAEIAGQIESLPVRSALLCHCGVTWLPGASLRLNARAAAEPSRLLEAFSSWVEAPANDSFHRRTAAHLTSAWATSGSLVSLRWLPRRTIGFAHLDVCSRSAVSGCQDACMGKALGCRSRCGPCCTWQGAECRRLERGAA